MTSEDKKERVIPLEESKDDKFLNSISARLSIGKVEVPDYVGNWITECNDDHIKLTEALSYHFLKAQTDKRMFNWLTKNDDNVLVFVRAWIDEYEVEEDDC